MPLTIETRKVVFLVIMVLTIFSRTIFELLVAISLRTGGSSYFTSSMSTRAMIHLTFVCFYSRFVRFFQTPFLKEKYHTGIAVRRHS